MSFDTSHFENSDRSQLSLNFNFDWRDFDRTVLNRRPVDQLPERSTSQTYLPSLAISFDEGEGRQPQVGRAQGNEQSLSSLVDHAYASPVLQDRRQRFQQDMQAFEARARATHMSPAEVSQTYDQISRIVRAAADRPGSHPLSSETLLAVASQVMHNAADPTRIRQADVTCNVTSMEGRTYTRTPSAAAHLVADVATTGSFTGRDSNHTVVRLDRDSLTPSIMGTTDLAEEGRHRTFASQLFQVTAVNMANLRTPDRSDLRYRQLPNANKQSDGEETFEVGHPENAVAEDVGAAGYADSIMYAQEAITGNRDSDAFLVNQAHTARRTHLADYFQNADDLAAHIQSLQRQGQLPAIVMVHGDAQLFTGNTDDNRSNTNDCHYVTVTGYNAATRTVYYDDQYGARDDHNTDGVPLDLFYHATYVPRTESRNDGLVADGGKPVK